MIGKSRTAAARTKRVFDFTVALCVLVLGAPVLLLVAIAVRTKLGSPVLFVQTRPGLHGTPFRMFKFRTMRDAVDAEGNCLADAERLTPFGRFLRATSLDELPELWNVVRGEMSLVGPRPLLVEYLPLYSPRQFRRHEMRPGITGMAQVNGRNAISWDAKFELDVWYVDHASLSLDLRILTQTVLRVLRRDGISSDSEVTMPRFLGND